MPRTKVGDIDMNYVTYGDSGDWVVLIGGLAGGNWQGWRAQLPLLAKRFRVLAFDNRGIGETDSPEYSYTTEMMSDDTFGLLASLGIENAHVVGRSAGGAVAQVMAINQPHRLKSLTMISTFAKFDLRARRFLDSWRNCISASGWKQFANDVLPHFYTAEFFESNPDIVASHERAILEPRRTVHGYMNTAASVEAHNTWNVLGSIKTPTLLLCGDEDYLTPPRQTEEIARRIPGAIAHIVKRASHGLLAERPDAFDIITDHIHRHS